MKFPPPPPLSRHPVDVGTRAEAAITSALLNLGYEVLLPAGVNNRYDLVVDTGDRFLRVQCKTGRIVRGTIEFNTVSVRLNTRETRLRSYVGEIEYFAVWCFAMARTYLVPIAECAGTKGYLRIEPTRNNQARGIRWAKDYELRSPSALDSAATPA